MMRLAGLFVCAMAASACTFEPTTVDGATPMSRMERSEDARARDARSHPECRDSRIDRDDQNDVCPIVGRAD